MSESSMVYTQIQLEGEIIRYSLGGNLPESRTIGVSHPNTGLFGPHKGLYQPTPVEFSNTNKCSIDFQR